MTEPIELFALEDRAPGVHESDPMPVNEFINKGQGVVTVESISGTMSGIIYMSYDGGNKWIPTLEFGTTTPISVIGAYDATMHIQPAPLMKAIMTIASANVEFALHFIPFTKSRKARTIDVS